ncbi:MAG: BrnT family toxin [Alphaproteobacteria bacterium]|nr:BrnT family toxin [Alphaproteobacteria bacterium]
MDYEWDDGKNERNVLERGLDFNLVRFFAWDDALIVEDVRRDYGERRFRALGEIEGKLYVLIYTMRERGLRVISLRRANERERVIYEKTRET